MRVCAVPLFRLAPSSSSSVNAHPSPLCSREGGNKKACGLNSNSQLVNSTLRATNHIAPRLESPQLITDDRQVIEILTFFKTTVNHQTVIWHIPMDKLPTLSWVHRHHRVFISQCKILAISPVIYAYFNAPLDNSNWVSRFGLGTNQIKAPL